jgi:transposase
LLVPSLRASQIMVMDNLGAHRPKRIRELIEQQGCELVYLPAYSPDHDPIEEETFAKIKIFLRNAAARTKGALVEAIAAALSAIIAKAPAASSSMPDTIRRDIYCETCCRKRSAGSYPTLS